MSDVISSFFDPSPRCSAFIVTIYGDIVEPRGGVLWMGNLINLCAKAGLNESLVRTSVSRLVSAGQLIGERSGRKSFYRLAPDTRIEYREVAQRVYYCLPSPTDWMIIARKNIETDTNLKPHNFVVMNRNLLFGPKITDNYPDGLIFEAKVIHDQHRLPDFVSTFWDVDRIAKNYDIFISKFASLNKMHLGRFSPFDCLMVRLALVHDYRHALAEDPNLPRNSLPNNWPADKARTLFAQLYLTLSRKADEFIHGCLQGNKGALAHSTALTRNRNTALTKILTNKNN